MKMAAFLGGGLLLCLVCTTARPEDTSQAAADPYSCPHDQVAVRDWRHQTWRCEPKLERKRDIFESEKSAHDPCPEGYWWHNSPHDSCAPVVCTEEPNGSDLNPKKLCPIGHHPHLHTDADWTHPVICVEHYRPENEKTGGVNPRRGRCPLCIIKEHAIRVPEWNFARPEDEKKKKNKITNSTGAARLTEFRSPAPETQRCARGAVSVRRGDGRMFCYGGRPLFPCPSGSEVVQKAESLYRTCAPCMKEETSVVMDGLARCVRNSCKGSLPVPEPGVVERYSCAKPREQNVDLSRILGASSVERAPLCPSGKGLIWNMGYQCVACPRGQQVIERNGYSVCWKKFSPPCRKPRVPVWDAGSLAVKCVECPLDSIYSTMRGEQFPGCVPESAQRAGEVEKSSASEQPSEFKIVPLPK